MFTLECPTVTGPEADEALTEAISRVEKEENKACELDDVRFIFQFLRISG